MFGITTGKTVLAMYLGEITCTGVVTQVSDTNYLIELSSSISAGAVIRDAGEVIMIHATDVVGVVGEMKIEKVLTTNS